MQNTQFKFVPFITLLNQKSVNVSILLKVCTIFLKLLVLLEVDDDEGDFYDYDDADDDVDGYDEDDNDNDYDEGNNDDDEHYDDDGCVDEDDNADNKSSNNKCSFLTRQSKSKFIDI